MKIKILIIAVVSQILGLSIASAQSIGDYLILQDIGIYKLDKLEKHLPGEPPSGGPRAYDKTGASGIDHFPDHVDKNYVVMYLGGDSNASPTVQISQHPGSDSDQWLLHELEGMYRNNPETDKYRGVLREVNGNKIFTYIRGTQYSWLSNNVVVDIRYTDLQKIKPEPLEVISAYLQKHPSTIPAMVMDSAHDVQWIKDEMSRRLWLCDKWVLQIQTPDPKLYDKLKSITDSMTVFLNYREKYYGMASVNDKNLLSGYLGQKNDPAIRAKLTEYKTWWTAHKNDAITLP